MPFYPSALAFSPDGQELAIAPVNQPVQIYDVGTRARLIELQRPVGGTSAVAFSRDGSRIATADADTVIRVYASGQKVTQWLPGSAPLGGRWTADGLLIATGSDTAVHIWRVH